MPPREAAALLAPVCRAIAYAHDRGVLHRDLKPSNILIDREGRPYVADFGLAKRIDPDSGLDGPDGQRRDPRHAQLHAPRAGRRRPRAGRPARATSTPSGRSSTTCSPAGRRSRPPRPLETILLVLEQDPVPPRALNPRIDPDLEMIALKCLQKRPDLRYPTADALADDLDAYLAGEPVSARSATLRPWPAGCWARRTTRRSCSTGACSGSATPSRSWSSSARRRRCSGSA